MLGAAPCVYDDLERAMALADPLELDVIAINDMGCTYLEPIHHWVSGHGTEFHWRVPLRIKRGGNGGYAIHGVFGPHEHYPGAWRYPLHGSWSLGSSGLLAVHVALCQGYERVVVAGMPLTGTEAIDRDWNIDHDRQDYLTSFRWGWENYRHPGGLELVRSMSGWTRDLVGEPTEGWLNG